MQLKRYYVKSDEYMIEHQTGNWCSFSEVESLQKRCTDLEQMLQTMIEHLDWAMKHQSLYPDEIAEDRNEAIKLLPTVGETRPIDKEYQQAIDTAYEQGKKSRGASHERN